MLHVRFYIEKDVTVDSLSSFCENFKHLSSTLEGHFFLDGKVLVFVSNASSFVFSCELINLIIKHLGKQSVYSEVLSLILN